MSQLSAPEDLEGYVHERLVHVIGSPLAVEALRAAKKAAEIDNISTVAHVIAVGKILAVQEGFVGIVGDLIVLEAERWGTR